MLLDVCALAPGSSSRPEAAKPWARFPKPRCHSPPNSERAVDRRRLFTKCQEDGTNLITPYPPCHPPALSGDPFNWSRSHVVDSRLPQVDSDSNYEYRVPL